MSGLQTHISTQMREQCPRSSMGKFLFWTTAVRYDKHLRALCGSRLPGALSLLAQGVWDKALVSVFLVHLPWLRKSRTVQEDEHLVSHRLRP